MSKYAISMLQSAEDMEKMQLEIDRLTAEVDSLRTRLQDATSVAEGLLEERDYSTAEVERLRGALEKIAEWETRDHYVECWRKAIADEAIGSKK